ncbi:MAG: hypothetical protein WDZ41_03600 [Candidatus Babeliales bacterium]
MIYLFFLLSFSLITANMGPEGFEAFPNKYFVETGTFSGDGIRFALRAGFREIHSIEINEKFFSEAKKKFKQNSNVHIWHGDSGKILLNVIRNIQEPITFWLDGHNGWPDPQQKKNTPLLEELEQIKQHHIKTHTILIDDMHCCNMLLFDFITKEQIIEKIKEINPLYIITYIDGGDHGEYPNNIMVAYIPENYSS